MVTYHGTVQLHVFAKERGCAVVTIKMSDMVTWQFRYTFHSCCIVDFVFDNCNKMTIRFVLCVTNFETEDIIICLFVYFF
jgi:hypothetical protein